LPLIPEERERLKNAVEDMSGWMQDRHKGQVPAKQQSRDREVETLFVSEDTAWT
jgi:hypothetical protein